MSTAQGSGPGGLGDMPKTKARGRHPDTLNTEPVFLALSFLSWRKGP